MNDIDLFWNAFLEAKHLDNKTTYLESFHFEMSEHLANTLLDLVLKGQKKATASSLSYYQIMNDRIPREGHYSIITDWDGTPHCVIKTTKITILPFKNITYEICKREGEDETLSSWQIGHEKFFRAEGKELGYEFSEDMQVLFEDFEVVFTKN